jgi:hypothetical protein
VSNHPATTPKKRNEPNWHPRVSSRASGCGAKRSGPKPRDLPKHHRRRRFQSNKPHPSPKNAKRTQFPVPLASRRLSQFPAPPIMQNEPNPASPLSFPTPIGNPE